MSFNALLPPREKKSLGGHVAMDFFVNLGKFELRWQASMTLVMHLGWAWQVARFSLYEQGKKIPEKHRLSFPFLTQVYYIN